MLICTEQIKLSGLNDNKSGNGYKQIHKPTHIHTFAHFTMTSVKRKILLNYRLYISPHLQQAYHIIHYRNFIYLGH